ncbi:MAG TPA: hypothetical protein DEB39_01075, partial [Planctomycetaceae bacterium]|nr:hypothetical protein [Planctomycetaceae bacterium]
MKNALVTITFFALTVAVLAEEVKLSFPLVPTDVCNFPNDPEKDIDVAIPVTLTDADGKTTTIRLVNGST